MEMSKYSPSTDMSPMLDHDSLHIFPSPLPPTLSQYFIPEETCPSRDAKMDDWLAIFILLKSSKQTPCIHHVYGSPQLRIQIGHQDWSARRHQHEIKSSCKKGQNGKSPAQM